MTGVHVHGGRLLAELEAGWSADDLPVELVPHASTAEFDGIVHSVIIGHKVATERPDGQWDPVAVDQPYGTSAVAVCSKGRDHVAPDRDCQCGFHALTDAAPFSKATHELMVALFGRMIVSAFDDDRFLIRAERQVVLRAMDHQDDWVPFATGKSVPSRARRQADATPPLERVTVAELARRLPEQELTVISIAKEVQELRVLAQGFAEGPGEPPGAGGVTAIRPTPEPSLPGAAALELPSADEEPNASPVGLRASGCSELLV